MWFSTFLFPESESPDSDFDAIAGALRQAELTEDLGFDGVWLAEHHFDGACAYVEPLTFAAAVAARTSHVLIGFAVAQTALHHPVRLAEEVALLDNLSNGRIVLGLGRGSAFNFYEYRGFDISPDESHERLEEAEGLLARIWTSTGVRHKGKFWDIDLPELRPKVVQQPHPPILRACGSDRSVTEMARSGRPFMIVVQTTEESRLTFDLYRSEMSDAGFDDEHIEAAADASWVWRNVVVAETDREAEEIGVPAFTELRQRRNAARARLNTSDEEAMVARTLGRTARFTVEGGLIYGSPETVAERLEALTDVGAGGVIIRFHIGLMESAAVENSMRLFAERVAPELRARARR